ncbi:AAA domain-containing protein [Lactonifactor sp. BIOML-A3]|uniref:AAA family ATPase n=1 Tax=unclassified Lactonifactor TaxID=2636670 RepID=UPI0012B03979|nr:MULTISPECIES: MoxR family ATPase [unclassified Lactonifactor]MRZ99768.1 AAA domain-containing protein [Lactonifactor sp. BIOML-A5]MSA08229.1 AAA domain-containing protein [Lactonifactor sp. BIOML-A4]MSA11769.1 AAA domain-containing protein [Lactonifactor sp. BIOML-A3]MSA15340.1 AAA domain-containing protein [Lactonifactor sp. BIOML-A2]MSA35946.1 AAA domain-containing protein [Lactonifactor sp. BIOML-A1]
MEEKITRMIDEVKKVIVGKDDIIQKVLMTVLAKGHILLEDIPGVGKTTLALAFSRALGLDYKRIQFTPDVIPSDVVGFSVYDKATGQLAYKPGAVMCNLLLADEINRTSSKTQAALLEVMEEGNVTVDGNTYQVPQPFIVLSTQNPIGSAGTQLLPQSQLDRFMVRMQMGYPDFKSQVNILRDRQTEQPLDAVQQAVTKEEIMEMQAEVQQVHVDDALLEYITCLAEATREHELVQIGVSPRGALAVNRMAKASAYMEGRDYMIPEDIIRVFPDVCAHRVVLFPKAKITNTTAESIMKQITEEIETPKIGE